MMAYAKGEDKSLRSREAIANYKVPYFMIEEKTINELLNKSVREGEISEADYKYLKRFKAGVWKYVSKECVENTEWHHLGKYYSKAVHYDLKLALQYILEHKETIVKDYITYRLAETDKHAKQYKEYPLYKFAYNVWGGNKRHPRIVNVEHKVGVDDGTWVYYIERGKLTRKKWSGNNVYKHAQQRYEDLDEKTKRDIDAVYEFFEYNDVFFNE